MKQEKISDGKCRLPSEPKFLDPGNEKTSSGKTEWWRDNLNIQDFFKALNVEIVA